jgi:cellulose synthase/poly-beta-1,6-N-acetylglucosamine synthase-like glycosyltransferase
MLASLNLPVPLGGTSNHFRTAILRSIGAWDPHNVTEDADLGLRLARAGYLTGMLDAVILEEANCELRNWLTQRSRWLKGWLRLVKKIYFAVRINDLEAVQLMVGRASQRCRNKSQRLRARTKSWPRQRLSNNTGRPSAGVAIERRRLSFYSNLSFLGLGERGWQGHAAAPATLSVEGVKQ